MRASATVKGVELGEYRINYACEGSGPTMIMLHGSDKREEWRVWEPLLELSRDYSLVIPDLVGFGGSTIPIETPDYKAQARVLHEMMERLGVQKAILVGTSWGGQVALEVAMSWPQSVEDLILISSTYDKSQLLRLGGMRRPTMIIWAEDDRVAPLKAGYLLRDSIGTSRLEVLGAVAKNPHYDFTIAHKLQRYKKEAILSLIRDFLTSPLQKIAEPPALEPELKGRARKDEKEEGSPRPVT
jgi:pimeloyl-ACP methyl ester carboxylesterase